MKISAVIREVNVQGDFVPLPTQLAFSSSPFRYSAFVGPLGSGKSEILCRTCIDLAVKVPDNRGVVGRYTYRDFTRTTAITLERVLIPEIVERQLPGGDGWVIRTSDPDKPSTLLTGHFDEPSAFTSMGLGFYGIDEVNGSETSPSVPEPVWRMLNARLGRDVPHVRNPRGLVSGNPGGHNYVWKYHHVTSPDRLPDAMMFTPQPFENRPNLPAGYYERLEKENGADWVSRYVYGSHEVFEGQVYPELSEGKHCVDPFPIPPEWPRAICLDHGLRNPTAVGFLAIGWDGEAYLYDEHYEAGRAVPYHAEEIKKRLPAMKKAQRIDWVADPSIFAKSMQKGGQAYSVADEYADCGLDQWQPGENDVAAGRNRVKVALATGKLKFFRGRVPNAWREMTGLHWKRLRTLQDRDAPEQEADVDNHSPDYIRYFLMSRPEAGAREKPAKAVLQSDRRIKRLKQDQREAVRAVREKERDRERGDYV